MVGRTWRAFAGGLAVGSLLAAMGGGCGNGDSGSTGGNGSGAAGTGTSNGPSSGSGIPDGTPPTVHAGDDVTITLPDNRTALSGSASDAKGTIAGYAWTQSMGPIPATLRNADTPGMTAVALTEGTYVFKLTATDDDGDSASDEVTVTVLKNPITPDTDIQHVQARAKAYFRKGHTLPPLTRWTAMHKIEFQKEMTERYFYALDLGDTTQYWADESDNPGGTVAQKIALKKSDPGRYPLSIMIYRPMIWNTNFVNQLKADLPSTFLVDSNGMMTGEYSPLAPNEAFQRAADFAAPHLAKIVAKAKDASPPGTPAIDVMLNGGEYGLGVWSDSDAKWAADPAVNAAMGTTDQEKFAFLSTNKHRQEQIITDAMLGENPGAMYVFYITHSSEHRERWWGWWQWTWDYDVMKTVSSPSNIAFSSQYYRLYPNVGWADWDKNGDGMIDPNSENIDMLTTVLDSITWQIQGGTLLSYPSVCAGWPHNNGDPAIQLSPIDRYMGFLKAFYTAGAIGGTAGYFTAPPEGWGNEDASVGPVMPNWVAQLVTLGEVHALFSHLEDFLRQGDLLPGPNKHRWSTMMPAYEFPTGDGSARVLARRSQLREEWLITAWAADGPDRDVTVDIDPKLGSLTLRARASGSVYRAKVVNNQTELTLVDADGMHPTDTLLETD